MSQRRPGKASIRDCVVLSPGESPPRRAAPDIATQRCLRSPPLRNASPAAAPTHPPLRTYPGGGSEAWEPRVPRPDLLLPRTAAPFVWAGAPPRVAPPRSPGEKRRTLTAHKGLDVSGGGIVRRLLTAPRRRARARRPVAEWRPCTLARDRGVLQPGRRAATTASRGLLPCRILRSLARRASRQWPRVHRC